MKNDIFPIKVKLLLLIIAINSSCVLFAQFQMPPVRLPDASPKRSVLMAIGLTDIQIDYHSPDVNNRKIWGALVPDGRIWRAGANENTIISFAHDVKINGNPIKAGRYGLHMIPGESQWTICFSKNTTSWGSFSYDMKEDELRISVTPIENMHTEWLVYELKPLSDSTAEAALCWEKKKIPFTIEADVKAITFNMLKNDFLRSPRKFDWVGPWYAALYLYNANYELEQGLKWIEQSITNGANFTNTKLKADILDKLGRKEDAKKAMEYAVSIGSVFEIDGYISLLVRQKKNSEALALALQNASKNPEIFQVNGGLARAYSANGKYTDALKHAKLMLSAVSTPFKPTWEKAVQKLEEGKDMNQ